MCSVYLGNNPSINAKAGSGKQMCKNEYLEKLEHLQKKPKKHMRIQSKTVISLNSNGEDNGRSLGTVDAHPEVC